MKKHAGAYLEGFVTPELKLGCRVGVRGSGVHYPLVGRIQVCVRVVPACDRCGAERIL